MARRPSTLSAISVTTARCSAACRPRRAKGPSGLAALGIETYPKEKYVNRGVLLDVARFKGVDALAPGYEITPADLEGTAKAQGVEVRAGDSVLIRTGSGKLFGDKAKYMGLRPGPGRAPAPGWRRRSLSDRRRPAHL